MSEAQVQGRLGQTDERPLTPKEFQLLQRLLSDPFSLPMGFKTWLVSYLETSSISLPSSAIMGLSGVVTAVNSGDSDWHNIGTAGEPAFQNSWAAYSDPSYGEPRFRRLSSGLVVCEGLITGGNGNTLAFTLPAGYRPALRAAGGTHDLIFPGAASTPNSIEMFRVDSNGSVRPSTTASGGGQWVSLASIQFFAGS